MSDLTERIPSPEVRRTVSHVRLRENERENMGWLQMIHSGLDYRFVISCGWKSEFNLVK